jgi:hypothetical protein
MIAIPIAIITSGLSIIALGFCIYHLTQALKDLWLAHMNLKHDVDVLTARIATIENTKRVL